MALESGRASEHEPPPRIAGCQGDAFVVHSIRVRLGDIVASTLAHASNATAFDESQVAELRRLAASCANGDEPLTPVEDERQADWQAWSRAAPGAWTWLSAPWFYVENYFYARMRAATGCHANLRDPFCGQKTDALHSCAGVRLSLADEGAGSAGEALRYYLLRSLWGNQADLSLSGGRALAAPSGEPVERLLVRNDLDSVCAYLAAIAPPSRPANDAEVCVVLDNCGLELLADLALADCLAHTLGIARVVLYAKAWPVFVSDALPADVAAHVSWLCSSAQGEHAALGRRLQCLLVDGRLSIHSHAFFTSPLDWRDMIGAAADLHAALARAHLVIVKGDANYRRLVGDRAFDPTTSPTPLLAELGLRALVSLRTNKSPAMLGCDAALVARLDREHPAWRVDGKYGMITAHIVQI